MKRVLVVSSFSLFNHGVESLLRNEAGLEIVGREKDVDKALERINQLRPDVVIIDTGNLLSDPASAVMRFLREGGEAKVITFSLEDNTMRIYCGERRVITEVGDLVRAIEHSPFSTLPELPA